MTGFERAEQWFESNGWELFDFQREVWSAYLAGESGLVHASTGSGKTLAVWMGPLIEAMDGGEATQGLQVLWITPLRALASDSLEALRNAAAGVKINWRVEMRTGDTTSAQRRKQRERPPHALITTPESLSLLLAAADTEQQLHGLRCVIVDEWHELMASKRGVQLELCLAHLRTRNPTMRTWGLSATLGNLQQARDVLLGPNVPGRLVQGPSHKQIEISTLFPPSIERFAWAGHTGTSLLPATIDAIEQARSTLVFTNTRSQAEVWYQALIERRLDWLTVSALHHGSIGKPIRRRIESALRAGELKLVVCTSSLDLGVDFSPVDQVIQVGSPRGVARLLQRAGRSGHRPGVPSRVLCVPTHSLELMEIAGARDAYRANRIEGREPIEHSLDVLVQHLMTLACGPGFDPASTLQEIRRTYAYATLHEEDWRWALGFLERGGSALKAYPQFHRIELDPAGVYRAIDDRAARVHRSNIGTITSDEVMQVRLQHGKVLGQIEEGFIARLRIGDVFLFAGRSLRLARTKDMTAYVKPATERTRNVPRWQGGRMSLSSELADAVLELFERAAAGLTPREDAAALPPEVRFLQPILELQARWSRLPNPRELLIERTQSREGSHVFIYPFAGRMAHEGLATLMAMRLSRQSPVTFRLSFNDYGFELLSDRSYRVERGALEQSLRIENLADDLRACVNVSEGARRAFRDIARIAGLVQQGFPGRPRPNRQVQASASLIFDVLLQFDPENRLVSQARSEVLTRQLESTRLAASLRRLEQLPIMLVDTARLTPLAFPLWAERLQSQIISSETWRDRVSRMAEQLERAAQAPPKLARTSNAH